MSNIFYKLFYILTLSLKLFLNLCLLSNKHLRQLAKY